MNLRLMNLRLLYKRLLNLRLLNLRLLNLRLLNIRLLILGFLNLGLLSLGLLNLRLLNMIFLTSDILIIDFLDPTQISKVQMSNGLNSCAKSEGVRTLHLSNVRITSNGLLTILSLSFLCFIWMWNWKGIVVAALCIRTFMIVDLPFFVCNSSTFLPPFLIIEMEMYQPPTF